MAACEVRGAQRPRQRRPAATDRRAKSELRRDKPPAGPPLRATASSSRELGRGDGGRAPPRRTRLHPRPRLVVASDADDRTARVGSATRSPSSASSDGSSITRRTTVLRSPSSTRRAWRRTRTRADNVAARTSRTAASRSRIAPAGSCPASTDDDACGRSSAESSRSSSSKSTSRSSSTRSVSPASRTRPSKVSK